MARDDFIELDHSNNDETRPDVVNSPDNLRSAVTTALASFVHVTLIHIAFWPLKRWTPAADSPNEVIPSYYSDPNDRRIVLFAV